MGALRMQWRLYDTSLPADSTGHPPLQAEAIVEAETTEKAALSANRLEAGLSLSEGASQGEESREEITAEKSETRRRTVGFIEGAALPILLLTVWVIIIYIRKRWKSA